MDTVQGAEYSNSGAGAAVSGELVSCCSRKVVLSRILSCLVSWNLITGVTSESTSVQFLFRKQIQNLLSQGLRFR